MEIVAQIYNWKITRSELDFEEDNIRHIYPEANQEEIKTYALTQLIDRYLLMQEAIHRGFTVTEEELENAILEIIDTIDSPGTSVLINRCDRGEQLERVVKSTLIIQKYLDSLANTDQPLTDDKLQQFYQERKDYFYQEEEVRASQILVKGNNQETLDKINKIRNCIRCLDDFHDLENSNLMSDDEVKFGDLGYFPKGRMLPEIDTVAFSMQINDISQPFLTKYGYHILMLTDKKDRVAIQFNDIKECLRMSLHDIEEELLITKILSEIKEHSQNAVQIFDMAFN